MVIPSAKNIIAFSACASSIFNGVISATIPKKRSSSITNEPNKSPSPMLACFLNSDFISTAKSGVVVPIPIIVSAMKYAGTLKYDAICTELNTSHLPDNISAASASMNISASLQMFLNCTFFFTLPSIFHSILRYRKNTMIIIAPSILVSPFPIIARTNGSISIPHISNLFLVKIFGSILIFLASKHNSPSASPTWTMLLPMIVPNPIPVLPVRNPVSELIISGAEAAIATTTSPIIESLSPSLLA